MTWKLYHKVLYFPRKTRNDFVGCILTCFKKNQSFLCCTMTCTRCQTTKEGNCIWRLCRKLSWEGSQKRPFQFWLSFVFKSLITIRIESCIKLEWCAKTVLGSTSWVALIIMRSLIHMKIIWTSFAWNWQQHLWRAMTVSVTLVWQVLLKEFNIEHLYDIRIINMG